MLGEVASKRNSSVRFVLFLLTFVFAAFRTEAQQSFQDQINVYDRDDVHSIHKKLYTKEGRHEIGIGFGGIFNNNGYALVTGQYTYHLFENLGIEAGLGGWGFQFGDDDRLLFYQGSVAFSPLYGKMSFFTWSVVSFDTYFVAGAGIVNYKGAHSGSGFMGNVGIGQRFFVNEFLSLKVEFRDYLYNQNRQVGESRIIQNFALTAGLSVMIPFRQPY